MVDENSKSDKLLDMVLQKTEDSNVSDFVELAQLAGVKIAPNVVSAMLELLNLGYSPSSIRKVCREVAKYKSRHEKTQETTMSSTK